jgi:hypothetical protein
MTGQDDASMSKNDLDNVATAGSVKPENVVAVEALKEIDEEVQYAIANHQSHLSPTSKQSWILYGKVQPTVASFSVQVERLIDLLF